MLKTDARAVGTSFRDVTFNYAIVKGISLGEPFGKVRSNGVFTINNIGSRDETLIAFNATNGIRVSTGCFSGSLEDFKAKVISRHRPRSYHRDCYLLAVKLIETKFRRQCKV